MIVKPGIDQIFDYNPTCGDSFIQLYPDQVTVDRLIKLLDLKELRYDNISSIYDGSAQSKILNLTYTPSVVFYVEVNGLVQQPSTYIIDTVNKTITYTDTLIPDDVLRTVYGYGVTLQEDISLAFTDLDDTPSNYTGHAEKGVKVNANEDGLEFFTRDSIYNDTDDLPEGILNLYFTDQRVSDSFEVNLNTLFRHTHENKPTLDLIINTGTGINYLADDGTYKEVTIPPQLNSTDDLPEGIVNFYYTDTRVDANLSVQNKPDISTQDELTGHMELAAVDTLPGIPDANTLYFITGGSAPSLPESTDDLPEGILNFYYTEVRVDNNTNVAANTVARHSHTNKTILDGISNVGSGTIISTSERSAINLNTSDRHSHTNKTILDGISNVGSGSIITSQERTNNELTIADRHSHTNKTILDVISNVGSGSIISTNERSALNSNTSNRHSHINILLLDSLTNTGSGDNYLSDDGTYKTISAGGSGDMLKSTYDPTNINADSFDYNNFINTPNLSIYATNTYVDSQDNVLQTNIDGKANIIHTHVAADITNLNTTNVVEATNLYYTEIRVSNNADVKQNTTDRHTHTNKTLLDNLISNGSGDNYLSDDGTYKTISAGGIGDMTKAVYDPNDINGDVFDYSNFIATNGGGNISIGASTDNQIFIGGPSTPQLTLNGFKFPHTWTAPYPTVGQVLGFPNSTATIEYMDAGDMTKSVYDPNARNADVFEWTNFVSTIPGSIFIGSPDTTLQIQGLNFVNGYDAIATTGQVLGFPNNGYTIEYMDAGDMTKSVYDPTAVNGDAFDYVNFKTTDGFIDIGSTTTNQIYIGGPSTQNLTLNGFNYPHLWTAQPTLGQVLGFPNSTSTIDYMDLPDGISAATNINVRNAPYVLVEADNNNIVEFDTTAATLVDLPDTLSTGFTCTIVNVNTGSVTLSATTLNAKGTLLESQWGGCTVYYDGTRWVAIGDLT